MIDRDLVIEGMAVRSADGKTLGRVLALGEDEFIVEKGWFFAHDYGVRYTDVESVEGHELILRHGAADLHAPPAESEYHGTHI